MLILESVVTTIRSRPFFAISSALVMVVGMLFGANIATAESVWVQSYERTSQTKTCAAQPDETPWQESWGTDSSWSPSWEQWANNGKGGWTCTRSIAWAQTPVPATSSGGGGSVMYRVGDIGPGGGLVFLISGEKTYEMAPKTWSGPGTPDAELSWCDGFTDVPAADGKAVGTGVGNTAAMADSAACSSNAAAAVGLYAPAGTSAGQWFIPSQNELAAMYTYKDESMAAEMVTTYGFAIANYWSSSQKDTRYAWYQDLNAGAQFNDNKVYTQRVRAVRAF